MKQRRAVIIALVNRRNQLLFQLRDDKPNIVYPNHWGFIGGGIENGESEADAIRRETLEEIGLEVEPVEIGSFLEVQENIFVRVYRARIEKEAKDIKLNEGQRVEFFGFNQIGRLKIPEGLKDYLDNNRQIFNYI